MNKNIIIAGVILMSLLSLGGCSAQEDFTFLLEANVEGTTINMKATMTYVGSLEEIAIFSSDPIAGFRITDEKGNVVYDAMAVRLISQKRRLRSNESITTMNKAENMNLEPGVYTVITLFSYSRKEQDEDTVVKREMEIMIQ